MFLGSLSGARNSSHLIYGGECRPSAMGNVAPSHQTRHQPSAAPLAASPTRCTNACKLGGRRSPRLRTW